VTSKRSGLVVAAAVSACLLPWAAHGDPRPATQEAEAPTRTLDVWIVDEKGAPVEGLTSQEVAVMEDGSARIVTRVERDTRPLTVAILVDSSAPQATSYRLNLVEAVAGFVRKLPDGTRYTLWTTGDRPKKALDLTDDRSQVSPALRKVFPTGGNTLLDAIHEASGELGERESERTAMVIVTGVGIGFTSISRQKVVDDVGRRGATVMAVQFEERGAPDIQAAGSDQLTRADYDYVLSNLTRKTAGVHERPLSAMGVDTALDKVAAALGGRYRVTYASEGDTPKRVEVQLARPGVKAVLGATR
jgi:VWFA-related protein